MGVHKKLFNVKKVLVFALPILAMMLSMGCGGKLKTLNKHGELTGELKRYPWEQPVPYGTIYLPKGSFHMGNNEQDVPASQTAYKKQVTISAFYIDDTEITNNEYRQFIYVIDDSLSEDDMKKYYPDTTVWVTNFAYHFNDPMTENYFWHPAFDEYPVTGITWHAARYFCRWRTEHMNAWRATEGMPPVPKFRLPTEAEWEYAARGGMEHKLYPWESPYLRNRKGCLLANFKPGRGDYMADGFEYTSRVRSYWPNDYGLYDMAGNVAEWCEDPYSEIAFSKTDDINPIYKDADEPRRVIRGGSWKDIGYFLSCGTRTYEYADTTKSFVGFRTVMRVIGHSVAE